MSKTDLKLLLNDLIPANHLEIGDTDGRGIYVLIRDGKVVYVGRTSNFYSRLGAHLSKRLMLFDGVTFFRISGIDSQKRFEASLIHKLRPQYNEEFPRFNKGRKRVRVMTFDV